MSKKLITDDTTRIEIKSIDYFLSQCRRHEGDAGTVYNDGDLEEAFDLYKNQFLPSTNRQPSQEQPEGKSAEEMVRDAVAIYGMDTVEAPLASIIELMESYASQPSRPELTVWPTNEDIAKIVSGFPNTSTRIMAIDLSNWLKTQVRAVDLGKALNQEKRLKMAEELLIKAHSRTAFGELYNEITQFLNDRKEGKDEK